MKYYLLFIELFAIVLYVIPKLAWNFFKYPKNNGALKIRIALALMALFKIGHIVVLLNSTCGDVPYWWSFGSTAAFISMFIFSELPHENKPK